MHAILTEDDLPDPTGATAGDEDTVTETTNVKPFMVLTNEPLHQGEPILAVAADSEDLAAEAVRRIVVDLEPLPFVVDPMEALRPHSANPRLEGNVWVGNQVQPYKLTEDEWQGIEEGRLPFRDAPEMWEVGNVEAGFASADLVLDETLVCPSTSHDCMEPRSSMAYWQNGKLYLHTSTQSISRTVPTLAKFVGIPPSDLVMIAEYCGGGFGSKAAGCSSAAIPALLSKKTNRPVMMRISRGRGAIPRDGARRIAHALQIRVPTRRPNRGHGPVHRAGQRAVPKPGRCPVRALGVRRRTTCPRTSGCGSCRF